MNMDWDRYGRVMAQRVSTSPAFAIMIYCGSSTNWPGIIMESIRQRKMTLRPGNRSLAKAYPARGVKKMLPATTATVERAVLPYHLSMGNFEKSSL